jgi:hypothetical protein
MKVLIALVAALVVMSVLAVVGSIGFYLFRFFGEGPSVWRERVTAAGPEGRAFGVGKSSEACLPEAVRRLHEPDRFSEVLAERRFLRTCLDAADQRPDFCRHVPAKDDFKLIPWSQAECARAGSPMSQACIRVVEGIQEHCFDGPVLLSSPVEPRPPPEPAERITRRSLPGGLLWSSDGGAADVAGDGGE